MHNITMVFPLNENQIPLWNVDSAKATPMQLTEAVRQFLAALWGRSCTLSGVITSTHVNLNSLLVPLSSPYPSAPLQ